MAERKCRGLNRLGRPCGNHTLRGSDYCGVAAHALQFKKNGDIPFYKDSLYQFYIATTLSLLGIAVGIYFALVGPSVENQETIIESQAGIHKKLDRILDSVNTEKKDDLLARYSEGYILFGIDHRQELVPYKSLLHKGKNFSFSLSSAKVLEVTKDEVVVMMPSIIRANGTPYTQGISISIPRQKGTTQSFAKTSEVNAILEILDDRLEGIISVIGFKKL